MMLQFRHRLLTLLPAFAALTLLASCHSVPKHAKLIPRDAVFVLSIHTSELRKELAWSAVTGSSLLNDLRKGGSSKMPEMMMDIENAGIDFGSTIYCYTRPDARYPFHRKVAAVLPVADAGKLTAYIQKHLPGRPVHKSANGINSVMPDSTTVVAWNNDVLIAMNSITQRVLRSTGPADSANAMGFPSNAYPRAPAVVLVPDEAATNAEVEAAFLLPKGADITSNARFSKVEHAGHDVSMYFAFDGLMDMAGANAAGLGMLGLSMGSMLSKNSAITAGFDFVKGALEGTFRYYPADSMQRVAKKLVKHDIDGDMLRRLPSGGLNMAGGFHLDTSAVKLMLNQLSLTGYVNMELGNSGLSADDLIQAFSGDIAFSLNNFRTETRVQEMDSVMQQMYGLRPQVFTSTKLDYLVGFKIGNKEKMGRLFELITGTRMMEQVSPGVFVFPDVSDGPVLVRGDRFIAIANLAGNGQAFTGGPSGKMPDAVREAIKGHPAGLWADVRSFFDGGREMVISPSDSASYNVVRNTFSTLSVAGGEWKGGANEYRLKLVFQNREENSLIQLLHMAQRLTAVKSDAVVMR